MGTIAVEVILHDRLTAVHVPLGPQDSGVVIEVIGSTVRIQAGDLDGVAELYTFLSNVASLVATHPDAQAGRSALRQRIGEVLSDNGVAGVTEDLLDALTAQVIS